MTKLPILEDFVLYLSEEKGIKIDPSIRSTFRFISDYFSDKEFTKENIRIFLNLLRTSQLGKEIKTSTLNKYVRMIRTIASYLGIHDLDGFRGYKVSEADTIPYGDLISDKDMKRICQVNIKRSRDTQVTNLKYRAALTLMRFTGIPPVDLCNLKWKMDLTTHFEYYRQKTGKHMIVPIVHELRKLLDKLPRIGEYVFGSGRGRMKEGTLRDEIHLRTEALHLNKHITPYSFRYSMITWCYINGGEGMMPKIARISGHSINTAMKHYAKFDVQVLIDALHATHPGLIRKASIDTIKRTIVDLIDKLIDRNKYEVDLTITPKRMGLRSIHLS